VITAAHLNKSFGDTHAVRDLNLQIAAGEIYGLVGPDGAGKTTTLRMLCAAIRPTHTRAQSPPQISLAGIDLLRRTEQARALIGYLPQRFALYEDLTVLENLRFFAEVRGLPAAQWRPRCMEILRFVGLDEFLHRRAGQLSGGMKQKLGLAAALVHRPKIILLDEPTTGVDPVTRQDFWQLIIRLVADEGVAVCVSTPYMDEAARCARVGFLLRGELLVEGTPSILRQRLQDRILELRGRPLQRLRELAQRDAGVQDAHMFGDCLHLRVTSGDLALVSGRLQRVAAAYGVREFQARAIPAQLEDVFMALLEEQS
jgi:ABC-2 type transport system ATP-binding protein